MINAICCLPFEAKVILRMKVNQKFVMMLDNSQNPIDLASFWPETKNHLLNRKREKSVSLSESVRKKNECVIRVFTLTLTLTLL